MKTIHEKSSYLFLVFQNAVIGNGAINIYGEREMFFFDNIVLKKLPVEFTIKVPYKVIDF